MSALLTQSGMTTHITRDFHFDLPDGALLHRWPFRVKQIDFVAANASKGIINLIRQIQIRNGGQHVVGLLVEYARDFGKLIARVIYNLDGFPEGVYIPRSFKTMNHAMAICTQNGKIFFWISAYLLSFQR
jgi:hypothetical protein